MVDKGDPARRGAGRAFVGRDREDTKGLRHLARLLARPAREQLRVLSDLVAGAPGPGRIPTQTAGERRRGSCGS